MSTIFEDIKPISVYCSETYCKFKKNDAYYNLCHNHEVINSHFSFMGGEVYVSGCKCSKCEKDCPLENEAVSSSKLRSEESVNGESEEFLFIYSKE